MRRYAGVAAALTLAAVGSVVSAPAFAAPAVSAADATAIASRNACMGCHAVDRKLVGPSFKDIAAKYKGDANAQAKLEKKVRDGGSGVWGAIPMPSHPGMSAADIHTVVAWVLADAPSK